MSGVAPGLGFGWHMPVVLQVGEGAALALPEVLGPRPAVVLTYAGALQHPLPTALQQALGERLLATVEVPDGLSSTTRLRALSEVLWPLLAAEPQAVLLGLGGGTVLDLAKVLRCRPAAGGFDTLLPALRQQGPWPALRCAPLWLLPTTAGTGSEVTRWATVWDTEAQPPVKRSFDEAFGYADRAFVDPGFTRSCPPAVQRDCALDALAHALEALWNRHANPVSNALAVAAARRILRALPQLQRQAADDAARAELSLAAVEAGLAFSQTRTALAHALSYALTLEAGTPHGLACAVWLPTAWRLAAGRNAAVDAHLAQVFDVPAAQGTLHLDTWLRHVGVVPEPAALGVSDAAERVAAALGSPRGRNFIGAPA